MGRRLVLIPGLRRQPVRALPLCLCLLSLMTFAMMMHFMYLAFVRDALDYEGKEALTLRAAGNRTLGFHSIKYLNIRARYDRSDAAVLQAYLAGIDFEKTPGVEPEEIQAVGMPPSSNPGPLKLGEYGCYRAHANLWAEIVQKRLPPTLIVESDAGWDVNLRASVALYNKHLTLLLRNLAARPLYGEHAPANDSVTHADGAGRVDGSTPWWQPAGRAGPPPPAPPYLAEPDPADPWHSAYWDMISFGQCFDGQKMPNRYLRYADPSVQAGKTYFELPLGEERVAHQSGGIVCTTAYAVTHRGAAKLLLRHALDLDMPTDMVMQSSISSGQVIAYSVIPPLFSQWHYKPNLGMEFRGANSDIQGFAAEDLTPENPPTLEGWGEAKASKNVWVPKPGHPDTAFKEMALQVAWERIYSSRENVSDTQD